MNTRISSVLVNLISQLESSAIPIAEEQSNSHKERSPDFDQLNSQIEEARSEVNGDANVKKE